MESVDLRMDPSAGAFSCRAAALILKDNALLAAKRRGTPCYYTIGGIGLHESSAEAAAREALEETGFAFKPGRLAFIQERFFSCGGKRHHEIVFFYLMKPLEGFTVQNGAFTDQGERETLHWLPLGRLAQTNLVPAFLKTALHEIGETPLHIITKEE